MSRWVGGSERLVRELFGEAVREYEERGDESELHVVVIDEIDAAFRRRGGAGEGEGGVARDSTVNQMLGILDGVKELENVLVIGMTNSPELLDKALLRNGRLEVKIEIPKPDDEGRRDIAKIAFRTLRDSGRLSKPVEAFIYGDGVFRWWSSTGVRGWRRGRDLTKHTKGMTGADIKAVVRSAVSFALERGASASGLGVAKALLHADPTLDVVILESSSTIGSSFLSWPPSTRFISPSFYSNPFTSPDLNQISPINDVGPSAYLSSLPPSPSHPPPLDTQHPTGPEYAAYLTSLASAPLNPSTPHHTLLSHVTFSTPVLSINPLPLPTPTSKPAFKLLLSPPKNSSTPTSLYARYVIYAGGEYRHPYLPPFTLNRSDACLHYSDIKSWGGEGDWVIVGAGEAGVDAACNIHEAGGVGGGTITVIDKNKGSGGEEVGKRDVAEDPSTTLTPRTRMRLRRAIEGGGRINVIRGFTCTDVGIGEDGSYTATLVNGGGEGREVRADNRIVMATGFKVGGSEGCVLNGICEYDGEGRPVLDEGCDESKRTKGVFVVGPMVKHKAEKGCEHEGGGEQEEAQDVIFCFIYKFRTRFALVAGEIISRLVLDYHVCQDTGEIDEEGRNKLMDVEDMMEVYKDKGMLVTDLSKAVCGEVTSCGKSC
ncbi:hypothetical protein TrCOL_g2344 [Triparma columacea]|uniref:Vesicle-fusing ATPase n=1 Tax=Triparma columacea TaxID=722753 RepID=A0A9W7L694_9STRA|nr:hypothetical protein TrCOL_g2344 [Triparma columacea]